MIINSDRCGMMPGNRDDIQFPVAEVYLSGLQWPVLQVKVSGHILHFQTNNRCIGPVLKLTIACCMVAMTMGVRNRKRNLCMIILLPTTDQAVNHNPQRKLFGVKSSAVVHQQSLLPADEQKHERSLIMHALALAQYPGVFIVPDYLNRGICILFAVSGAMYPGYFIQIGLPLMQDSPCHSRQNAEHDKYPA